MKVSLKRIDENFLFELQNQNGHKIYLDDNGKTNPAAVSPMEALLMAVVGCGSMDISAILNKQKQEITHFSADVEGERIEKKAAHPFKKIKITYHFEGKLDPQKAKRAVALSFDKYCSVVLSLDPEIELSQAIVINGENII